MRGRVGRSVHVLGVKGALSLVHTLLALLRGNQFLYEASLSLLQRVIFTLNARYMDRVVSVVTALAPLTELVQELSPVNAHLGRSGLGDR